MIMKEEPKNPKSLVCRNNLTYERVIERLNKYFSADEVKEIMSVCDRCISWTDGNYAIICTNSLDKIYTIVAPSLYTELVEP